jgi:hypothetical protein
VTRLARSTSYGQDERCLENPRYDMVRLLSFKFGVNLLSLIGGFGVHATQVLSHLARGQDGLYSGWEELILMMTLERLE